MSNFGLNIRHLRQARNLSMRDLAKQVGVSASSLSRVERGHTDALKLSTARKLATVFGVTFDDLLAEPVVCLDCGMPYIDFPLDVVLPDEQWALVSGRDDGSGILCAACIVKRAAALKQFTVAKMTLE